MQLALSILVVAVAIILTTMVVLQSGKNEGLGAIAGGGDTFLAKNKAKSMDAKLTRMTKYVSILFVILVLALCLI